MPDVSSTVYWRQPFTPICNPKQLVEYIVMDIDILKEHVSFVMETITMIIYFKTMNSRWRMFTYPLYLAVSYKWSLHDEENARELVMYLLLLLLER